MDSIAQLFWALRTADLIPPRFNLLVSRARTFEDCSHFVLHGVSVVLEGRNTGVSALINPPVGHSVHWPRARIVQRLRAPAHPVKVVHSLIQAVDRLARL